MSPANIIRSRPRIKPEDDVVAFCDTVQVFFTSFPAIPKGRWLGEVREGKVWGQMLTQHQPTPRQLFGIDNLGGVISRVDVSIDYMNHNPERVRNHFLHHCLLKGIHRKWEMHDVNDVTTYWVYFPKGERRGGRQLVIYGDRTSKVWGKPCVHVELRLLTAEQVREAGILKPSDILNLNPDQLFRDNTQMVDAEINAYLRQQRNKGVKHKVAMNNLKRITQLRAQNIRRTHPQITLTPMQSDPLCIPFELQLYSQIKGRYPRDHAARGKTWIG